MLGVLTLAHAGLGCEHHFGGSPRTLAGSWLCAHFSCVGSRGISCLNWVAVFLRHLSYSPLISVSDMHLRGSQQLKTQMISDLNSEGFGIDVGELFCHFYLKVFTATEACQGFI